MSNANLIKEYISLLIESRLSRRSRRGQANLEDLNIGVIERKQSGEYFIVLYDGKNPNIQRYEKEFIKVRVPSSEKYESFIDIEGKSRGLNRTSVDPFLVSRIIKNKSFDPVFIQSTINKVKDPHDKLLKSQGYNNLGAFILLDTVNYSSIDAKVQNYNDKLFKRYYSEDQRLRSYRQAGFTGVLDLTGAVSGKVHEREMNAKLSEKIENLIDSIIEDGSDKIINILERYFSESEKLTLEEEGIESITFDVLKRCLSGYYNDNKEYINPDYKTITLNEIEKVARSASYLAALPFMRKDKNKDKRGQDNLDRYSLGQKNLSQSGMGRARQKHVKYLRGK